MRTYTYVESTFHNKMRFLLSIYFYIPITPLLLGRQLLNGLHGMLSSMKMTLSIALVCIKLNREHKNSSIINTNNF